MNPLSNTQLFDRYTISRGKTANDEYVVKKLQENGIEKEVSNSERDELLTTNMLAGSIGFTRDTKHVGWLHKCIYAMQKVHLFCTRSNFVDPNICHGVILIGLPETKSKVIAIGDCNPKKEKEVKHVHHPFVVGHAVFSGIQTSKRDYMTDPQVTEFILYRPRDEDLRKIIVNQAKTTCHSVLGNGAKVKAKFSLMDLALSAFYNRKHKVCGKKGPPPKPATERTAYALADYLLKNQILDRCNKPKQLICSGYTAYTLQVALFGKNLKDVDQDELQNFTKDLTRSSLADKIFRILNSPKGEISDKVSKIIHTTYWESKLARYDARFAMSCYLSKILDKLSMTSTETDKVNVFNYKPKALGYLKRAVLCYKESTTLPVIIKRIAVYIGAFLLAAVSIGTAIPLIVKAYRISKKIDFEKRAANYKLDQAPPTDITQAPHAQNSIHEFVLDNGLVWYRRLEGNGKWKHLYFDEKIAHIATSGEQLIATDATAKKHVRNVIQEARGYKAIQKVKRHIADANFNVNIVDKKSFVVIDRLNKE